MQTDHWQYQYPKLAISGLLKSSAEDFRVTEQLGYEPTGEGEHIYLWVQKTGLNTAYLAEQIAKFTKLPLRAVTYAGRKDKYAQTLQWFSVHLPGKGEFDWSQFSEPGAQVIRAIRHNKKLKTGVLKGNQFDITLRQLTSTEGVEPRLQLIKQQGVPNYFGQQRFGDQRYDPRGGNLVLAEKMLHGEIIKNRNKRSMAISALRSWFFNEMVHKRLVNQHFAEPLCGDVMQLAGSQSFFVATEINQDILARLQSRDIYMTAPLWGAGSPASELDSSTFEKHCALNAQKATDTLAALGLKQERRAIRLFPDDLEWEISDNNLRLSFSLPAGAFATSVIREVMEVKQPRH